MSTAGEVTDVDTWHRLHPLSPVVRTARHTVGFAVIVVLALTRRSAGAGDVVLDGAVIGVVLVAGLVSWLVTRWRVAGSTLQIESGLLRRRSQRLPLGQVQAIDVVQTAVARVFGLAELRLRMAGASGRGGRLSCLPLGRATELRATLLAVAHTLSVGGDTAAAAAEVAPVPEQVVFRLRTSRLVVTTLLGRFVLLLVGGAALLALGLGVGRPRGTVWVLLGVYCIGFALIYGAKRIVSDYSLAVSDTGRGFRLRAGMLQTTEETIRPGRIQAVRLVEPLLWRPFGWCRLDVDVAGSRSRRENEVQRGRLRSVVPVGTLDEARSVLDRLLPDLPRPTLTAPARARWKSPLAFHNLSWGSGGDAVVATGGRLRRETNWVPLAKVQSVRWMQGPLQRRLDLATVRLDTAGRSIHTALKDRAADEAAAQLAALPGRCREARQLSG